MARQADNTLSVYRGLMAGILGHNVGSDQAAFFLAECRKQDIHQDQFEAYLDRVANAGARPTKQGLRDFIGLQQSSSADYNCPTCRGHAALWSIVRGSHRSFDVWNWRNRTWQPITETRPDDRRSIIEVVMRCPNCYPEDKSKTIIKLHREDIADTTFTFDSLGDVRRQAGAHVNDGYGQQQGPPEPFVTAEEDAAEAF